MNKIRSASKAHHQVLEKEGTYFVQYTGQIFSAFDEVVCTFPVKSPPGCKISLYLHSSLFDINIDIGAE